MEENRSLLNILSSVIRGYLSLKTDDYKRQIMSGLAVGFGHAFSLLVLMMLMMIILMVFAFAFIVLIADAIGSWWGAALIVGGVFLVAFALLFLMRKRLVRYLCSFF